MACADSEVVVVGAGPAGSTASVFLSRNKINHILIDREKFPRDKICGDAMSGKVVNVLNKIDVEFVKELASDRAFHPSYGVRFFSPGRMTVDLTFKNHKNHPPGFIAKREVFDNYLFSKTKGPYCTSIEGTGVSKINCRNEIVEIETEKGEIIKADLVIMANGDRKISINNEINKLNRSEYCGGLRNYYENVSELLPNGEIELHFLQECLPGYFWIFPMSGNLANVGIGMLSKDISKNKVDLKKLFQRIISDSHLSKRFEKAVALEKPKGWGLPLGGSRRQIASARLMKTGDAASLIDPFTGEGISNAMISGMKAGEWAARAVRENTYSAKFLAGYQKDVYNRLGNELRISRMIQKLLRYPFLFDLIARKNQTNPEIQQMLMGMFDDIDLRRKFFNPMFYLRLLIN